MLSLLAACLGALSLFYTFKQLLRLRVNIAAAKASGIPYIVLPVWQGNRLWQLSQVITVPILSRLPKSWTEPWLKFTLFNWGWIHRYAPFAEIGSDTLLTVSPERINLNTADASVISQIAQRRNDFPKPIEIYEMLRIYGSNLVVTEGQDWRRQRKIVSPQFSEANNEIVWNETLKQAQSMTDSWFRSDENRSMTIRTLAEDTMRLSLHIISKAGFGMSLEWPSQESHDQKSSSTSKNGHKMAYREALGILLDHLLPIIIVPRALLRLVPIKTWNKASEAYNEWGQYMWELFHEKKALLSVSSEKVEDDLMTSMLRSVRSRKQGEVNDARKWAQSMSDEEVIGNSFVFILAGHETTANAIHFVFAYLAMNVRSQRRLQKDLDELFKGKPVSEWKYDQYISALSNNMAGAVLNEILRLIPPVVGIPKCTRKGETQSLKIGGKQCTVPENTYIELMCHAAHRNPNQWPSGPPRDPHNPAFALSNLDNDLEEFKPERWFLKQEAPPVDDDEKDAGEFSISDGPATTLFRPRKGAYIPFSEGVRSCIGRRFAQVELLAFLAVTFSRYSIELAVDEWATGEQVEKMDEISKQEVWNKARTKIERQIDNDCAQVITLQLRKGHIPLRLVRRGFENFDWK